MIRGVLLRVKTAQVSAAHQREVASLGVLREREVQARTRVQTREEAFWREIAFASSKSMDGRTAPSMGDPQLVLARALEAHRLLKQAKEEHTGLACDFNIQLARVLRATTAVTVFKKMQAHERIRHQASRSERLHEEVAETFVAARLPHTCRAPLTVQSSRAIAPEDPAEQGDISLVYAPVGIQSPVNVGMPSILPKISSVQSNSTPELRPPPTPIGDSLALHAARIETSEKGPVLQVQVESRGVPVSCGVAAAAHGGVGIVVEVSAGKLSKQLEQDRGSLVAKLAQVGIKVTNVEVRLGSSSEGSPSGYPRRGRRMKEEDDENTIT